MNVSKEAREAAARMMPCNTIAECERIVKTKRGRNDKSPLVQAFAKFEAEITHRVRAEALEEAAKVAEKLPKWCLPDDLAIAIRQMIGGEA